MPPIPISTDKLQRLYEVDGLSLRQIAARFGVSYQAIHDRFVKAGISLRPRSPSIPDLNKELLETLYIDQHFSILRLGEVLGVSPPRIRSSLIKFGIPIRPGGAPRRVPSWTAMAIGESIIVPRPTSRGIWHGNFYHHAKSIGIKISVKTIDKKNVKLTRIS